LKVLTEQFASFNAQKERVGKGVPFTIRKIKCVGPRNVQHMDGTEIKFTNRVPILEPGFRSRLRSHFFWKLYPDPDPHKSAKLDPLRIRIKVKNQELSRLNLEPWTLKMEACRPDVADSHHLDEEQDPHPH
jgi:hypothetical protein